MAAKSKKDRRRSDYPYLLDYRTRWSDNDSVLYLLHSSSLYVTIQLLTFQVYDHMNNSIYNFLYDSIINTYLIEHCGLHPPTSSQYGLVVHSEGDYFGSIAFPAVAELGLRVNKLGKTAVTYEIALFQKDMEAVKSVGNIVHVFVERETGRPAVNGMNERLRRGLEAILVRTGSKL